MVAKLEPDPLCQMVESVVRSPLALDESNKRIRSYRVALQYFAAGLGLRITARPDHWQRWRAMEIVVSSRNGKSVICNSTKCWRVYLNSYCGTR